MTVTATTVFMVALIPSIAPAFCPDGTLEESEIETALQTINNIRSDVVKGIDPLPKGKNMNKLDWSCTLEKDAIDVLNRGGLCGLSDFPADKAPMIEYEDIAVDEAIERWNTQTAPSLKTIVQSKNAEVISVATEPEKFLDLIRASTTQIGCARAYDLCDDNTFVLCFTNQPPLKNSDTIYEVGDGACTSEAGCDPGTSCDTGTGLCEIAAETTTTVADKTTSFVETTAFVETTTFVTTTPASYPGELPSGTNKQCPSNVGMTDELRNHFLDTQNYRRSILAKGQVQRPSNKTLPMGANIIKLNFNCTLENKAIQEVRQCPTSKIPHGEYGKNFDTFASSTVTSTYRDAIKKAVTNWWKVVRKESNAPGMQVTFRSNHVNQPVESYTQIAWANTRYIGCAIAKCDSSYAVICLYEPKGNIVNEVLYKIGSPCAACPNDTTCDSALGLCVPKS